MVTREDLLRAGAVAIVRMPDQDSGQQVADRIVAAGLTTIEITMTNPGALSIIEKLAQRDDVQVGVGTVVDSKDVVRAKDAGAQFIVSPNTDEEVIRETKRCGLLSLPGVATPSEVAAARKIWRRYSQAISCLYLWARTFKGAPRSVPWKFLVSHRWIISRLGRRVVCCRCEHSGCWWTTHQGWYQCN